MALEEEYGYEVDKSIKKNKVKGKTANTLVVKLMHKTSPKVSVQKIDKKKEKLVRLGHTPGQATSNTDVPDTTDTPQ